MSSSIALVLFSCLVFGIVSSLDCISLNSLAITAALNFICWLIREQVLIAGIHFSKVRERMHLSLHIPYKSCSGLLRLPQVHLLVLIRYWMALRFVGGARIAYELAGKLRLILEFINEHAYERILSEWSRRDCGRVACFPLVRLRFNHSIFFVSCSTPACIHGFKHEPRQQAYACTIHFRESISSNRFFR